MYFANNHWFNRDHFDKNESIFKRIEKTQNINGLFRDLLNVKYGS